MKPLSKIIKLHPPEDKEKVLVLLPESDDLLGMAKYMEKEKKLKEAAKLYEKIIKKAPLKEFAYNRLMMIYRKQKNYHDEFRVISAGIKAFHDFYTPAEKGRHKNIIKLSKALNLLTGLTDKKGKHLHDPEPIAKWKKRKEIVMKKL